MAKASLALCHAQVMETKGKVLLYTLLLLLLLLLPLGFSSPLRLQGILAVSDSVLRGGLATRNLGSPVLHEAGQGIMRQRVFREPHAFEEELVRGRMDIQIDDYPGSGANDRHDPRKG